MGAGDLMSVAQAAEVLGVSGARIRQMAAEGIIPSQRVGSQVVLVRADVERLAREGWPGRRQRRS